MASSLMRFIGMNKMFGVSFQLFSPELEITYVVKLPNFQDKIITNCSAIKLDHKIFVTLIGLFIRVYTQCTTKREIGKREFGEIDAILEWKTNALI